jgi:hypothetical protein
LLYVADPRRFDGVQPWASKAAIRGYSSELSGSRATTKIGMANLVYNIKRFIFLRNIAAA